MFFYFFIYFIMWAFKITILNTYINKMKYTRWGSIIYQKITCAVPESLFWEVYITVHTEILVLKGTYSFIVMSTHEIWVWKNTHSQSPALGIIQITYSWINKGIIAYLFWNYLGINHFYEIKNYRRPCLFWRLVVINSGTKHAKFSRKLAIMTLAYYGNTGEIFIIGCLKHIPSSTKYWFKRQINWLI